jgi:hypothetical protein
MLPVSKHFAGYCRGLKYYCRKLSRILVSILLVGFLGSGSLISQTPAIILDSVSVNPDNSIIIGWTLNTLINNGYVEVHRRLDNGLYALITKVLMPISYYIDAGVNAQNKAFSYYVVAYDANNNVIGNTANVAHQTVFLDNLHKDICGRFITVNWSNYTLMTTVGQPVVLPSPFQQGELISSFNNGAFQTVFSLDGIIEESKVPAEEPGDYCFYIRAVDGVNNISSTSNIRCFKMSYPAGPDFIYIRKVSVDEASSEARISVYADNSVSRPAYVIEKFSMEENIFFAIDTIDTMQSTFDYSDNDALINTQSELYRVVALDSCRKVSLISDQVASIFLTVQSISPTINQLSWNTYEGWPSGIQEYIVQRKVNDFSDFENAAVLDGGSFSYSDDLSFLDASMLQGNLYYRIIAVENAGNPYGFKESTISNIAVAEREIEIFIPNAFRPESEILSNRVFKPVFTSYTPSRYSLGIYNRWSERIFFSEQVMEAWDGSFRGGTAPAGVYSYVIIYDDNSGNKKEKRGTLLLIR